MGPSLGLHLNSLVSLGALAWALFSSCLPAERSLTDNLSYHFSADGSQSFSSLPDLASATRLLCPSHCLLSVSTYVSPDTSNNTSSLLLLFFFSLLIYHHHHLVGFETQCCYPYPFSLIPHNQLRWRFCTLLFSVSLCLTVLLVTSSSTCIIMVCLFTSLKVPHHISIHSLSNYL